MSNIKCPPGYRKSRSKAHHSGCVQSKKKSVKKRVSKKKSKKVSKKGSKKTYSRSNIRCPPGYKKVKGKGCQPK